jgi:hypothetical protein
LLPERQHLFCARGSFARFKSLVASFTPANFCPQSRASAEIAIAREGSSEVRGQKIGRLVEVTSPDNRRTAEAQTANLSARAPHP